MEMLDYENLTQKIKNFCDIHGLTYEDIKERYDVRQEIYEPIQIYYPNCELHIFGSTVNGYGTKNSDLDLLFLPFPNYECDYSKMAKEEEKIIPSLQDVKLGKVSKTDLCNMNAYSHLQFIRKILRKEKIYQMIVVIPAKCPIVHFNISCLEITCDISCGMRPVIQNTKLLHFFNQIDERVRPLVMTLRHWGKSLNLIQSGVFSSYGFTLLVIFFLQNVEPAVLPSVKYLKELSESSHIIDGWNVSFTTDIRKVKKSKNNKSSGELFMDFFVFYSKFDFLNQIVCPESGCSLAKGKLLETTDERLKEFEISVLSIQDPFVLSHNVGNIMKDKTFQELREALYLAPKILHSNGNLNFDEVFSIDAYKKLIKEILYPPMSDKSVYFNINCLQNNVFSLKCSEEWKEIRVQTVCQVLLNLLQYGLLIDCEVIDKATLMIEKTSKPNENQKQFKFLMSIQCAVYYRTYIGRAKVKEVPCVECDFKEFSCNVVRDEFIISNYLIQQNPLLSSSEPFFWFYCDCYLSKGDLPYDIAVVLTPLTNSNEWKSTSTFLTSFLRKNVSKILSDISSFSSLDDICVPFIPDCSIVQVTNLMTLL